jgi:4-hydroxy-tetrahydrodipicolinate reductase|tara:strand:- start:21 stop:725 length:705 start_codon:yes stop_codon:yes gene_type:complete
MKIALFGYGKMGKEIEQIALQRGHEIVLKINEGEQYDISIADIAIDFSVPNAALSNIVSCFRNNVPVISGTTGWLDDFDKAIDVCKENNGSFIYASNFSIGVNIFFELNKQLAKMMNSQKEYSINVEEIHHTKKLDTPSGTAITLAEGIINNTSKRDWQLKETQVNAGTIPIEAKRILDVPGTHIISYESQIDSIEIKHTAHNRKGFALGAVIAAEWLNNKIGIYTMKDVLNIG